MHTTVRRPAGATPRLGVTILTLVAAVGASGCRPTAPEGPSAPRIQALASPAPPGSTSPGLTADPAGKVILSWQLRRPDSTLALQYADLMPAFGGWSAAAEVQTGPNQLPGSIDPPSLMRTPNGVLVATWRGKSGPGGYDILSAHSADGGKTWSSPKMPHRDGTVTEHGFLSFLQLGDTTGMMWVDGRRYADADTATRATQLTYAALDAAGDAQVETFVDAKICDCCHTSSAAVPGGAVVVYRDRRDGEIRDISLVRWSNGSWRKPISVHDDGWHIAACPVNGPAVASQGANVAVAWFTAARDTARVRLAFSTDTAATFGPPIEVNEGPAEGRVGIALLPDGSAIVSWIERRGTDVVLRIRRVNSDGAKSPSVDVATFGAGKRAGGMPRMVTVGGKAVLAWGGAAGVEVAVVE